MPFDMFTFTDLAKYHENYIIFVLMNSNSRQNITVRMTLYSSYLLFYNIAN